MRTKIHIILSFNAILYLSTLSTIIHCQNEEMATEYCYNPNIKTILLYRSGWDLSMPVIIENEDENLELRFDYLGQPENYFSYSIKNCTFNWMINDISEHYYIEGFNETPLDDYNPSRNTTRFYMHYYTKIPSEDLKIIQSGNYLLTVFDSSDPDKIQFTRRFCIAEKKVDINARVRIPDNQNQEIELSVDLDDLKLINPIDEIKVIIIKNYDWNNKIEIKQPAMLRDNQLFFDLAGQISTGGGNEFRYFDTKTTKVPSERVDYIEYQAPDYNFILKHDKLKEFDPYFSSKDLNGRFYIEIPDAYDRHTESDYVEVHFTLQSDLPLSTDVYLYGALAGWKFDDNNFMVYDSNKHAYEKTLLLKQGYYNYAYATHDYDNPRFYFDITEGNHSETENDYLIFVYLKTPMSDFDRLVGYSIINSTDKMR